MKYVLDTIILYANTNNHSTYCNCNDLYITESKQTHILFNNFAINSFCLEMNIIKLCKVFTENNKIILSENFNQSNDFQVISWKFNIIIPEKIEEMHYENYVKKYKLNFPVKAIWNILKIYFQQHYHNLAIEYHTVQTSFE